jgi:hypothetical protein
MMIRSTSLLFFCILLSATGLVVVQSFTTTTTTQSTTTPTTTNTISTFGGVNSGSRTLMSSPSSLLTVLHMNKDPSRSGTKKDRMNRLAEMEELGSANDDKGVFIKAAGGFVAFIVIAIAAAASSGLLTQY